MRLAWRLAAREVMRRKGRTLMVALLVALTVGGIAAADLAYRSHNLANPSSFGAAAVKLTSNPSVDVAQTARPSSGFDDVLADLPRDVLAASGYEAFGLPVQRADRPGLGDTVVLTTLDLSDPVLRGATRVLAGRLAAASDEVTVGSDTAVRLQVDVGDTLQLVRPDVTYTVVGIADRADGNRFLFNAPGFPVDLLTPGAANRVAYVGGVPSGWYPTNGNAAFVGIEYPPATREPAPEEIVIVWLAMTLLLGVLGIVIAAAFAASGRRQLVTLGQLGASGADARVARRFLSLQGAATSAIGALVGIAGGVAVVALVGEPVLKDGRWDVRVFDVVMIVATTVAVGTIAALLPTRSLAKAPILTALAGRAPVKEVRPWQVPLGIASMIGGLGVLGFSVSAVADGAGDAPTIMAALLGGAAVLGGMCALSPVVVDRWQGIGRWSSGTVRLAVRSMVRHRARSAALVAAIAAVGAAGVAGASGIERWHQLDGQSSIFEPRLDVVTVGWDSFGAVSADGGDVSELSAGLDHLRSDVDQIVPGVQWAQATWLYSDDGATNFLADDATLTAMGVPRSRWEEIRSDDRPLLARANGIGGSVIVPEMRIYYASLVSPSVVAESPDTWHPLSPVWIGVAPQDLTDSQREQLTAASFGAQYSSWYTDVSPGSTQFSAGYEFPASDRFHVSRSIARWLVIIGLLILVTIIVSIGLALWAAEGKVERDQLVAVGAPPTALARMAGVRAWVIATTGGLIAVPLGWVMLWTILNAAGKESPFPTITALMVVLAIPLLVAGGAMASSRVAQAVRPVNGSTMSLD